MILVGYAYWGRWHHESGAQPIIESLIRARNQPVFFIDGGASFGMYSFLAASIDKVAKVIAVEAAQRTFECLQRSVEESEYSARIECIHSGLADSVDRKIFKVI